MIEHPGTVVSFWLFRTLPIADFEPLAFSLLYKFDLHPTIFSIIGTLIVFYFGGSVLILHTRRAIAFESTDSRSILSSRANIRKHFVKVVELRIFQLKPRLHSFCRW